MVLFGFEDAHKAKKPREGELYRVIEAHGAPFELYYGYYDDADRQNPLIEPMEMYPDFIKAPVYTADGYPFVTAMQKPCEGFRGELDEDSTCYQCLHFEKCEELLGICRRRDKGKGSR
jgi:hypothetical protein